MSPDQAMRRWVVGHHAFFVLLQGMVVAHRKLKVALECKDIPAAKRLFRQAADIMNGSAAAMLFAGSMPPESYVVIRRSMTPPNVPKGFSGLWSADHEAMMSGLKSLRDQFQNLDERLEAERCAWSAALDKVYDAHAFVCERFVGNGPSLAMESGNSQCERSALQNIEVFRQRAHSLGTPVRIRNP